MFSPFNPAKILHYSTEIQNYLKHGKIPNPAMVSFDFANPCTDRCIWCAWERHRMEEGGFLDEEVFESIISDMVSLGITGSECCGGGEPLLHPHAHKFLSMLGNISNVLLITNGALLIPEDGLYCKKIRVSLDASTDETYKKLHQSNRFEQVINNVKDVAEITNVGLAFLIHPENVEEIPSFAELGKKLGCSFVQIRPCYTDYDIIRDRVGFDWFTWINNEENERNVLHQLEQAKKQETNDFKVYATTYKTKPKKEWEFEKCYAPYFNPQITPSGGVWICCEQRGEPEALIGTIGKDGTLKDIWFSDKHRELMEKRPNKHCFAKCKFNHYNTIIHKAYITNELDLDWI